MKFSVVTLLLFTATLAVADHDTESEGKTLIQQAVEKMNIFALPGFQMTANVTVNNSGKPLDGSYRLLWNGQEKWREEISFPGYSETRVGGKGVVLLKRSTNFIPLRIQQLRWALGYGTGEQHSGSWFDLVPNSKEEIKKIRQRRKNGSKMKCAEVANPQKHSREVCVDDDSGAIVRQQPFEDKDVKPIGSKLFPRFLSYVEDGTPVAKVQITEFKTAEQLPVLSFEPPEGSVSQPGCMNPSPPVAIHKVSPFYPEHERQTRIEGTVSIYTSIGKDGVPRGPLVVSGVSPGLETRRALKRLRSGVTSRQRAMASR